MEKEKNIQQEFLDRLRDVELDVTVRFGQTELPLREVAALGGGSMIELNRTVDEPVELLVNDCPYAIGEVVVVDGYYSVRVTKVSPPEKHPNTFLVDAMDGIRESGNDEDPKADSPVEKQRSEGGTPQKPQQSPPSGAKPAAPGGPPKDPSGQKPPSKQPPAAPESKPREG